MGIFDKFGKLAQTRREVEKQCSAFFDIVLTRTTSTMEAFVNGRHVVMAGSNNYLGLTFNEECIDAACRATQQQGTGTTGSRMANGTLSAHVALERELSEYYNRRHTIVFSTGYVANLAMLSTVVGPGDVIVIDADCHASIYDGCRLGGAEVIRFRHNDVGDLDRRVRRLAGRDTNILIVVEGIYSMLGDQAPLAEIADVKHRYGAYLLVDEAHSLGVLGPNGRGLAEASGVEDSVDFVVGTFSKSLGAIGGFCTSDHPELNLVRYASRPYVFTASSSPSIVASTRMALKLISRPEPRERLWNHAHRLYRRLKRLDLDVGPEASPIVCVRFEQPEPAYAFWNGLLERGVYVNLVLPTATPDGGALLRCSLSAAHTREQVDRIGDAFASLAATPVERID